MKEISGAEGTVFLEPFETIHQVVFPQSGMISQLVVTQDGNSIEASTVGREGAVGLHRAFGQRRSFTRAIVQIPGRFSVIPAQFFQEISLGSEAIRAMVARYMEILLAEAQQTTACNAIHDASTRLCRRLLQSADRTGSNQLPLTQELLALMLGVRRTTVSFLAQELQAKGVIQYRRGQMVIRDRQALEACACECYHVMHPTNLPSMIGVEQ